MNPPRLALPGLGELMSPAGLARVLLDRMTEGVNLSQDDGTIVYANPAEDQLFGYAPGELLGQHLSIQNADPPEENGRVVAGVIEELKRSGVWRGEWRNRRKDGSAFTTRSRISTLEIEGQRFWLCVREDMTDERATSRVLGEERTRLKLATEAAEIGIWDWDLATGRMTYSERAKTICGFPLDRPVTIEDARRVVHPEDHPRTAAQARRAMDPALRDKRPYEYRLLRDDGALRWVLAQGEAVFEERDGETRAVRFLGTIQDVTARRRLEEAERTAAQRLRLALDAGHMAVWDADLVRDAATGSPELNRLLGFPEDEPLDLDAVRARYYPGDRERINAAWLAARARGETAFEADYRYIAPGNDVRWFLLRCDIRFDEDGTPARALGVLADITDRKRAEEDLRASEARLQLASAAAGVGVWDWNIVTGQAVWSPEEYALFGVDPSTPALDIHDMWLRLVHPDDRAMTLAWMDRARQEGGAHSLDYRIRRPDGELRWIRSRVTVVTGPDGQAQRMVGIELDVSEEHARAEALRSRAEALEGEVEARRQELDRFFTLSSDLFAVGGFDGGMTSVNPAWSRLLGYSEEELLSRPVITLIHPDDRPAVAQALGRMRAGSPVQQFQDRLIRRDGQVVWVSWAGVAEGERFYAVGRDITHEREREEILRQTQKMEALGQLTGGIAHDFNNLLQAVQGSFALIRKRPADAHRVGMLAEQGLQAARRGSSLTAQLLAFSRAQQLEVKPLAIGKVLRDLRDLLRPTLGPRVEVRLDLPTEALAVHADATQFEMAVLNLALNARDAMPEGGTITVRAELRRQDSDPELPPGDYVALHVTDTGTGMTPEVAERAFEPFFTTKGLSKGTGLGLSQVYAMARQSGGTVRLDTCPGRGTTVCVFLRRAEDIAGEGALATGPLLGADDGAARATVLVIDDDEDVRRWLVAAIEALGHRVIEARDGRSGLAALDQGPDLLLVDFAMPGMNGAEVAQAARRIRPDLPIVLATGYADMAVVEKAMGPGSVVLRKPFELDALDAAVANGLGPAAGSGIR